MDHRSQALLARRVPDGIPGDLPALTRRQRVCLCFHLLATRSCLAVSALTGRLCASGAAVSHSVRSVVSLVGTIGNVSLGVSHGGKVVLRKRRRYVQQLVSKVLLCCRVRFVSYLRGAVGQFCTRRNVLSGLCCLLVSTLLRRKLMIAKVDVALLTVRCFLFFRQGLTNRRLASGLRLRCVRVPLPFRRVRSLFNVALAGVSHVYVFRRLQCGQFLRSPTVLRSRGRRVDTMSRHFFSAVRGRCNFSFHDGPALRSRVFTVLACRRLAFHGHSVLISRVERGCPFTCRITYHVVPVTRRVVNCRLLRGRISHLTIQLIITVSRAPRHGHALMVISDTDCTSLLHLGLQRCFSQRVSFLKAYPTCRLRGVLATSSLPIRLVLTAATVPFTARVSVLHVSPVLGRRSVGLLGSCFFQGGHSCRGWSANISFTSERGPSHYLPDGKVES